MPLLHADRQRSLAAGSVIELGPAPPTGEPDLDERLRNLFPDGVSRFGERLSSGTMSVEEIATGKVPRALVEERWSAEIDLVAELVRRDCAPEAPSRFQSIFACRYASDLRAYAKRFGFSEFNVVELDVDDGFRVDARWLQQGSPLKMWDLAVGYWSQEPFDGEDDALWEHLVPLPVRVSKVRPR